jgi:hypothetical protein
MEMAARMAGGVPQANGQIAIEPLMDAAHVANSVLYMASPPLDANVQFLTVMATKMPLVGRGLDNSLLQISTVAPRARSLSARA